MAREIETVIDIPELDSTQGKAKLSLTTMKCGNGQIVSTAQVEYLQGDMIHFLMFGDFRKIYARNPGRATQKVLEAQHTAVFGPDKLPTIKAEARAYYADKRKNSVA